MRVILKGNQIVTRPLARQPKWPLLSAPAVTNFRDSEVLPRLAQIGVSTSATDYEKMRALCQAGATMWWQHPAAYPNLRFRGGGDSTFAVDEFDPIAMWTFVKTGGTRTGVTVNDAGTVKTGDFTFTGLKSDFSGPADGNKVPTECSQQHELMHGFAAGLGIQSRLMNIGWLASNGAAVGHVPYEYWDRQLRKWVILDCTYGILGLRLNGKLLSWAEVHRLALAGRAGEIAIEYIPGYNSSKNPDLNFDPSKITALAVKWYMATVGTKQSLGLPKDASVVLVRSGRFTDLQGSNWPESGGLHEVEYPLYALQVLHAEPTIAGISCRLTNTVPNFARYEWRTSATAAWQAVTGNTVIVPSGSQVRAIDDLGNSSNVVTVEVSA